MAIREIIRIDEELCDGCALCVPACAEGAIKIIDGKARLISETYCDGMGACLGECPQNAITIERRDAAEYNETAVEENLKKSAKAELLPAGFTIEPQRRHHQGAFPACPGSLSRSLNKTAAGELENTPEPSSHKQVLSNWPVQLMLAPTRAPYFDNADLVIAADCVPFAFASFEQTIIKGRTLLIACPKLDNVSIYLEKLRDIFAANVIQSITIAFMEVPCCFGLVALVKQSLEASGKQIPVNAVKLGIRGELLERKSI